MSILTLKKGLFLRSGAAAQALNATGVALANDMVAFWKLDEASGQRNDSKGSNHLTDMNTVTQAVGKLGNAAQFTAASSECLTVSDNAALSTGDIDFYICAWAYLDSKGTNRIIASKDNQVVGEYQLFFRNASDRFSFGIWNAARTTFTRVEATTFGSPSLSTWYFVQAWHNAAANTIHISINNGTADSAGVAFGPQDGASSFQLGCVGGGTPTDFWNGRIDAVGIMKRLATSDERTYLWNDGAGREYPFQ
jgi:hypothetical protein